MEVAAKAGLTVYIGRYTYLLIYLLISRRTHYINVYIR